MITAETIDPPEQGDSMTSTATAIALEPSITVCPPGKRAGKAAVARRPVVSEGAQIVTATALQWPSAPRLAPPSSGDRRSAQERVEAAERAEAMSVALAQPHRDGSDDPRLAFPLGRFCASVWRNDVAFGNAMHAAGAEYSKEVRAVKVARGEHVVGSESENPLPYVLQEMAGAEIAAAKALIDGLERTLDKADSLLRGVMPRCPRAMVNLCFDHLEPSPYDASMLSNGIYRLAVHYGKWEKPKYGY